MPYEFYVANDGTIGHSGESDATVDQFLISNDLRIAHDVLEQNPSDIYIHKEMEPQSGEYYINRTKGIEVSTNGFGIGRFLTSDGFGPCILVLAKLSPGGFGLYHASDPYTNIMACQTFLMKIKDKVTDIYIFQKTQATDHLIQIKFEKRARRLQKELLKEVEQKVKVSIVKVDEYFSVVVSEDKVFLSENELKISPARELDIKNMESELERKSVVSVNLLSPTSLTRTIDSIKTIYVKSQDEKGEKGEKDNISCDTRHRRALKAILHEELEHLSQKTMFCGFQTYNMKEKTKELDQTFYLVNNYFPIVNKKDIENFINFKLSKRSKSIKEVLALSTTAYSRVCKKIEAQFSEEDKNYLRLNI